MDIKSIELKILITLQYGLPFVKKPFCVLANAIGFSEEIVLTKLLEMKSVGIIKEIMPVMNYSKLGFKSTLCAFAIDEQKIDEMSIHISNHNGVSHNYKRDDKFNLWFTLLIPKNEDFAKTVKDLAKITDCKEYMILSSNKTYKRRVFFLLDELDEYDNYQEIDYDHYLNIDNNIDDNKIDKISDRTKENILALLYNDLEIKSEPFSDWEKIVETPLENILNYLNYLKRENIILRFSGFLNYMNIGYVTNALVVWEVDNADNFGNYASNFKEISHCYSRKVYPFWRYNLYTMIHTKEEEKLLEIIKNLQKEFKIKNYKILKTKKKYKKNKIYKNLASMGLIGGFS